MFIYLIKSEDISNIIPQLQPAVIILTVLLGVFMFGEKLTVNKIIGTCLIIWGMIVINMKEPIYVGKRPWKLGP